jgi:hypothetical protein
VRLSKSGEPTTARRSAVSILRKPPLRPRRASVPSEAERTIHRENPTPGAIFH